MAEKKMTYVEALEIAIAVVENEEAKEKLIALQSAQKKKASSKKKKDQSEWENKIIELLTDTPALTPTEIMAGINAPNTQKVGAVLRGMLLDDKVVKEQKGKVVKYSLVAGVEPEPETDEAEDEE